MATITEHDRRSVWNEWLDGSSVNGIARYSDLGRAAIKAVIEDGPPPSMSDDPRVVHGGRAFWITAPGVPDPEGGGDIAFVIVRTPRTYTGAAFRRAIGEIRRDVKATWPGANLGTTLEGLELDVAVKFMEKRGYPGWRFDAEGAAERIVPAPATDDEAAPRP